MSLTRPILKFSAGMSLGLLGICLLPETAWPVYDQRVFTPTIQAIQTVRFWWHYYSPRELQARKTKEIEARKKEAFTPAMVEESPQEMRRKVKFFSDVNYQIRRAEMQATQEGVTKREREEIIYNLMRKHYPELFIDSTDILREELEKRKEVLVSKAKDRLTVAPDRKTEGYS